MNILDYIFQWAEVTRNSNWVLQRNKRTGEYRHVNIRPSGGGYQPRPGPPVESRKVPKG